MKKLLTILTLIALTACTEAKTKVHSAGPAQEDIKDLRAQVAEGAAIINECGGRDRTLEGVDILSGVLAYLSSRERSNTISTAEGRLLGQLTSTLVLYADRCREQVATEEGPEGP